MNKPDTAALGLTIIRTFSASRRRVFAAFTNADQLSQWWGPDGFTAPVCRAEAHAGGELYIEMCGPKGTPWEKPSPMFGRFVEVVQDEKIVFSSILKNDTGEIFLENLNSITLTESGGKTTMTLVVTVVTAGPGSDAPLSGMYEGWKQTIDRLEAFVHAA